MLNAAGPAGTQVLVDTVVFSPVHILGYFAVMNAGEGGSWRALEAKVRTDFVPTLAAELAVWPALQAANFKYIRVDYQLLAVNLVTILGEMCCACACVFLCTRACRGGDHMDGVEGLCWCRGQRTAVPAQPSSPTSCPRIPLLTACRQRVHVMVPRNG